MARATPNSATSSFFICINDQPSLDFGGKRNPDGFGFAAFGKVIKGMDIVKKIQSGENKNQHYREKSQKYSDENRRLWEDIRHGFIYGSQKFVKKIKDCYMVSEPDPAIPQQKSIIKDSDPVTFSSKASKLLQFDLESIKNSPRVSQSDKTKRDILLYLLWQEGKYTNKQIGAIMGLTQSAVSRRISITKKKMALEQDFERWVKTIKSQIKP
mgnify:CR=1 FL=1